MVPRKTTLLISGQLALGVTILLAATFVATPAIAQEDPEPRQVQELTGRLERDGDAIWYLLPELEEGTVLYVLAERATGNLDPFVMVAATGIAGGSLAKQFSSEVALAVAEGHDPVDVVPETANERFLAWDDDSGGGFAAALEFQVPETGDYQLGIASAPLNPTFGEYRLLIGLDEPSVLVGTAEPNGEEIAFFSAETDVSSAAVQEITGSLSEDEPVSYLRLGGFDAGDKLYVYIEATAGDLVPQAVLRAYGTKPIRNAVRVTEDPIATLEHAFTAEENSYGLEISGQDGTTGEYRLLIGRNVPQTLLGNVQEKGTVIARPPIEVEVGVKLQQITNIDQTGEMYGAVYTLQMQWTDPALAFSPADCHCEYRSFSGDDFEKFVTVNDITWPDFTLINQQGNRWIQDQVVTITPNGKATYLERFTTDFQAPDFDFRQFPFDTQDFFLAVDSLLPWELVRYSASDTFNEVGNQLGEEEWYVTRSGTVISKRQVSNENATARFKFFFSSKRHITFYVIRILVPLGLIIVVAWITFFMEDYGKRVEATSANLLLFIAFNFTISDDLPRLGYVTFLDALLLCTFVISVLVVIFNVYLKRQENRGRIEEVERIDRYMIWFYPLVYITAFGIVTWRFFGLG
jgi:hypothetical protein